jgi:hypothetical protein
VQGARLLCGGENWTRREPQETRLPVQHNVCAEHADKIIARQSKNDRQSTRTERRFLLKSALALRGVPMSAG